jgi:hypothetical protein
LLFWLPPWRCCCPRAGLYGDTQAPTTTVSDQLVRPTPAEEDEVDEEENDGDQKGKKKEKRSGKDRGKRDADGSD